MTRVYASTVLDASVARVWQILRDYNGHDRWHPVVAQSQVEQGIADAIGAARRLRLQDGSELREQLFSLSDAAHEFRYCLLSSPLPLMEAAGVIETLGLGVTGAAIGDRVAYACPPVGVYAERRNMSPDLMVHLGEDVSDETAAASLLKGVSASFLLHDIARVQPGMSVLIHAAAGRTSQILVQWAKALGCEVLATSSTTDKLRLKAYPLDAGVATSCEAQPPGRRRTFVAGTCE